MTAAIPKNPEERIVETVRFSNFIGRIFPLIDKLSRPGADLVPGQAHRLKGFLIEVVFVDPLDLMKNPGADTHAMSNH